jgi:hypothetical protein
MFIYRGMIVDVEEPKNLQKALKDNEWVDQDYKI